MDVQIVCNQHTEMVMQWCWWKHCDGITCTCPSKRRKRKELTYFITSTRTLAAVGQLKKVQKIRLSKIFIPIARSKIKQFATRSIGVTFTALNVFHSKSDFYYVLYLSQKPIQTWTQISPDKPAQVRTGLAILFLWLMQIRTYSGQAYIDL